MTFRTEYISGLHRKANILVAPLRDGQGTAEKISLNQNGIAEKAYRKSASLSSIRPACSTDSTAPLPRSAVSLTFSLPSSRLRIRCSRLHGRNQISDHTLFEFGLMASQKRIDSLGGHFLPRGWWLLPAVFLGSTVWAALILKGLQLALN